MFIICTPARLSTKTKFCTTGYSYSYYYYYLNVSEHTLSCTLGSQKSVLFAHSVLV